MDATTFGQLIDRYAAALVLYARQWCAAPEDVVQDAFLALMAKAAAPEPVAPWLFRVVRNRAISAARSDRRRQRREQAVGSRRGAWFRADPAGELDTAELRDALAELPAEQREVIVAHLWGGLTFEEVSALAGCSTSMGYRRYVAGVEALRARLGGTDMSKEPDDLMAFTRTLAAVPPDPGRLNRDALLFAAGRAAGRRGAFWPALAGALAMLSVALGVVLVMRPPTLVEVERVVFVPTPTPADAPDSDPAPPQENLPTPPQTSPPPGLIEGLHLRQRVLRDGVESLPRASFPFAATPPAPSPDDVPDLPSLRLNASHDGGPFR